MIKILIADDHPLIVQGIRRVISLDEKMDVIGEAATGWEVIEKLSKLKCDLILLDMRMPGPSGIELIRRLRRDLPKLCVVVVSVLAEPDTIKLAIQAGAAGYVTKDSEPDILLAAVRRVLQGRCYIDPAVAEKLILGDFSPGKAPHEEFSGREQQVFELMAAGKANKEIAWKLNLSVKTVSTYKTRIKKKLAVHTNMDILRYAIQHRISGK